MTDEEMLELLLAGDRSAMETWEAIVAYLRSTNDLAEMTLALEQGRYDDVIKGLEEAGRRLAQEWTKQFVIAATAEAALSRVFVSYDATNPYAIRALSERQLETVAAMSQEARELVQSVVSRGLQNGVNPSEMARSIRSSLGLTADQESFVYSYERSLRSGSFSDVRRRALHDGRYDQALRRGRVLSEEQVERMVAHYRTNLIGWRSEVIARDVALTALHEGSEELFRQAFERGEMDPSEVTVTWSSALRPNTRDSHRGMHGQTHSPGVAFTSGAGYMLRYPGDPRAPASERVNCLCVLQRRYRPNREVAPPPGIG